MAAIQALDLRAAGAPHRAGKPAVARLRIATALRGLLALLLIGNLGRLPVWSTAARTTPILVNDLALVTLLVAGVVAALQGRRLGFDLPATLGVLFAGLGGLSALLAIPRFGLEISEFLVSIAYLLRWLAYFGIYLVVINFVDAADVNAVWTTLKRTVLAFAAFGIIQSLLLPGFAQMVQPDAGWDVQGNRLVSTFLDPNFAGGLIAVVLLVLLARMSFGAMPPLWQPILLLAALLLTISRSSLLCFLVGSAIIVTVRGLTKRVVGFGSLVALLLLPFLPLLIRFANEFGRFSMDGSAAFRIISWLRAIEVFVDNPVIGIGFNTYGFVQRTYGWRVTADADFSLDGGLLFVAVTTGLIGLALYSGMILAVLSRCRSVWQRVELPAEERGLALGAAAATIGLVIHSFFLNSLLYPFLMEVLWVLWGLTCLIARPRTAPDRAVPEQPRFPIACRER